MQTAKCVDCHMPKTAKSGAGRPGISVGTTVYWQGDISSHEFAVPSKDASNLTGTNMPTPYTAACGQRCHTRL